MDKEELEKEAKDFESRKHYRYEDNDYCGDIADGIVQAYLAGAEPREKRIEELEKENALLKGRNEGFELQIMGLLIKYEEVYKHFPDLKSAMDKAKAILKENAELKEQNRSYEQLIDTGSVTLMKDRLKNYKQLTKAKELLRKFIEISNPIYFDEDRQKVKVKAERFLKED